MLEHMGLKVISRDPLPWCSRGTATTAVWIHDFGMPHGRRPRDRARPRARHLPRGAGARSGAGEMEDDGFNRLVLRRRARLARGHRSCAPIANICARPRSPSARPIWRTRSPATPRLAALLVKLFRALFDPAGRRRCPKRARGHRRRRSRGARRASPISTKTASSAASSTSSSRPCGPTSSEGGGKGPKPYLSFKLDSRAVDELPLPRPLFEISVYSPRVEAIHLRGGKVARGGIRWSDRREDFRTEVLGLMKAQMVKNAVIVPDGLQGRLRREAPAARPAAARRSMAEVVECYKTLMRGLLDITDNLVGGKVQPPADVVRRDRRRSLSGGRRRQGHGHLLRHRQRRLRRIRLLARRRLRLRRLGRLRPQGHGASPPAAPGKR